MSEVIYQGSDTLLRATIVDIDGEPVTDAAVSLETLQDCDSGEAPAGITLPLTLDHVADGVYTAQVDAALEVDVGQVLDGVYLVESTAGDGTFSVQFVVRKRTG